VTVGQKYRFAAFAYDKTTIDAYPSETNIDPAKDLLWGLSAEKTISSEDKSVGIDMARQFAQVQVNATVSAGVIKAIGKVQVKGGKQLTTFNPWNGTGVVADSTQTVSWPTISSGGEATIYGNARTVYPVAASPVEISIGSITVNDGTDKVFTNQTAKFTRTLVAGMKYTLTITIRQLTCGTGGNAGYQLIGDNMYLTHEYGYSTSNMRCWMVQNSMEGTPSAIGFGLDENGDPVPNNEINSSYLPFRGQVNGYYYSSDQKTSACPSGWRVPSTSDLSLISATNPANSYYYQPTQPTQWWYGGSGVANNAFAGLRNGLWSNFNSEGYWWLTNDRALYASTSSSYLGYSDGDTDPLFSVRCIRNL
jgi:uncharacterized protein (TIGR02145 family)